MTSSVDTRSSDEEVTWEEVTSGESDLSPLASSNLLLYSLTYKILYSLYYEYGYMWSLIKVSRYSLYKASWLVLVVIRNKDKVNLNTIIVNIIVVLSISDR